MAKNKTYDLDFDDYEEKSGGYNGETPKRGIYDGALYSFKEHESEEGNEGFQWIFEITDGPYKGWRGYTYSNMGSAKWKTQQIAKAIQGGQEKPIKLKPTDEGTDSPTVTKAGPVRLALRTEKFDDETRAKIGTVLPPDDGVEGGGKKAKKKKKGDDPF